MAVIKNSCSQPAQDYWRVRSQDVPRVFVQNPERKRPSCDGLLFTALHPVLHVLRLRNRIVIHGDFGR